MSPTPQEIIARLVSFDTTSDRSNLELIELVADLLAGAGIEARVFLDSSGRKANLLASAGPVAERGILLAGHSDVVPAGDEWSCDPFRLTETDDGRLVGRGTADMKGFLGIVLALLLDSGRRRLVRPVHFALTYDEEVGCDGARELVGRLGENGPLPLLVVLGEPTGMKVVSMHKGLTALRTTVTGRAAHSSAPQLGTSAVVWGARLVTLLDELASELRGEEDPAFEPPFSTLNVGRIDGGTASNVIAERCDLVWEVRPLPGTRADAISRRAEELIRKRLLPAAREHDQQLEVETRTLFEVPALPRSEEQNAVEHLVLRWAGATGSSAAPFVTEAGIYREAGIPAFVCGPGTLEQAHQRDEHLTRAELAAGVAFVERALSWAADEQ